MCDNSNPPEMTAILGAGLTGITAAYVLNRHHVPARLFEAESVHGGASRTVQFDGFRFDLGGHRFYTKNREILELTTELLGEDLLTIQRRSRIYLWGKLVNYPLSFFNALSALGLFGAVAVATSYAVERFRRLFRHREDRSFEDWVVGHFGRKLYDIYFRPYSEKVWGVPCTQLKADFAAQRIKGLSFREAVQNMLSRKRDSAPSLVSRFLYPRLGFGQIPEAMVATLPAEAMRLRSRVIRLNHDGSRVTGVVCTDGRSETCHEAANVVSTIPLSDLVRVLSPPAPAAVREAAAGLRYRDMIVVFLTLDREQVTPDHWVYFSTDDVFFGRMHEPKNWSAAMSPPGKTGLVIEVFCFEDEPVWDEPAESLARRVAKRLAELELIREDEVSGSTVVRLRKAYPLYVGDYAARLDVVFEYLSSLRNLQTAGRNGIFRYTSADYYMEMGVKAAENILGKKHDLRDVASAQTYAEC